MSTRLRRYTETPRKYTKTIQQYSASTCAMGQYLYIPFLVGWTSIYQLFWGSPGVQGFDTLPCINIKTPGQKLEASWINSESIWSLLPFFNRRGFAARPGPSRTHVKNTKRFYVMNPTAEPLDFIWQPEVATSWTGGTSRDMLWHVLTMTNSLPWFVDGP